MERNPICGEHERPPVSSMYNLEQFDQKPDSRLSSTLLRKWRSQHRKLRQLSEAQFYRALLQRRVPILAWLPAYKIKSYLLPDIVAGITVAIMNIPQGMAYAMLATLSPVYGLYISFFPVLVYALFGTSPHLAIGSIAVVSLLTGEAIDSQVNVFQQSLQNFTTNGSGAAVATSTLSNSHLVLAYRVQIASSLTLLVGLCQLVMGLFGLGVLSSLFSDTFISGYTCSSAVHVLFSQLKDLLGLTNTTKYEGVLKIPKTFYDLCTRLPTTNWKTLLVSLGCIIYLLLFKDFINPVVKRRFRLEFPAELLLIIATTLISFLLKFSTNFQIDIVNNIPKGLPTPSVPSVSFWPFIYQNAIIIALIAFSINVSLGTLFSRKHKYKLDSNQELYAYGASNVFSSFFQCFPSAASLSRSSVLDGANAKTLLGSMLSSLIIITVILFLGPLFEPLPKACLSSIIVVALKNLLFQVKDIIPLWRRNKSESFVWIITFLAVVLLEVDLGLLVGLAASFLVVLIKDYSFRLRTLTLYKNSSYVDTALVVSSQTQMSSSKSQYKILKVQRSLYFINCQSFKSELLRKCGLTEEDMILLNRAAAKQFKEIAALETLGKINEGHSGVDDNTKRNSNNNDNNDHKERDSSTRSRTPGIPLNSPLSSPPHIVLDIAAINYMDTNGAKVLRELIEDFAKLGVLLCVCEAQYAVLRLFHNMDQIELVRNHFFVTVDEAVLYVENRAFGERALTGEECLSIEDGRNTADDEKTTNTTV